MQLVGRNDPPGEATVAHTAEGSGADVAHGEGIRNKMFLDIRGYSRPIQGVRAIAHVGKTKNNKTGTKLDVVSNRIGVDHEKDDGPGDDTKTVYISDDITGHEDTMASLHDCLHDNHANYGCEYTVNLHWGLVNLRSVAKSCVRHVDCIWGLDHVD